MNTNKVCIEDVKKLREKTNYGLKDCKDALEQHNGCFESAIKFLREKYASKYSNAELNTEDSANGSMFCKFYPCGERIAYGFTKNKSDIVANSKQLFDLMHYGLNLLTEEHLHNEQLATDFIQSNEQYKKELEDLITYFREPMSIENFGKIKINSSNQILGQYFHNKSSNSTDHSIAAQKGAILILNADRDLAQEEKNKLQILANMVAMSIIANEEAHVLKQEEIKPELIESFKNKCIEEQKSSGKPENVVNKIVEGQMKKFFEANALENSSIVNPAKLEWLPNEEMSIIQAIEKTAKILNVKLNIPYYKILRIVK